MCEPSVASFRLTRSAGAALPSAFGLRLGQSDLTGNACFRRNRVGEGKARPTARGRTVKGLQTGTWCGPQASRPRTRVPGEDDATAALVFLLSEPGLLGGPNQTGSSLRGAERAKGPLKPGADNCPSCPRAFAAGAIFLFRTRRRHPHGPRRLHAGSGPAGRTRTWSRQGRATRNVGSAQTVVIAKNE